MMQYTKCNNVSKKKFSFFDFKLGTGKKPISKQELYMIFQGEDDISTQIISKVPDAIGIGAIACIE